jgi:1,4-dihydroxy-2-naphthoate octaprenyltransferase
LEDTLDVLVPKRVLVFDLVEGFKALLRMELGDVFCVLDLGLDWCVGCFLLNTENLSWAFELISLVLLCLVNFIFYININIYFIIII